MVRLRRPWILSIYCIINQFNYAEIKKNNNVGGTENMSV